MSGLWINEVKLWLSRGSTQLLLLALAALSAVSLLLASGSAARDARQQAETRALQQSMMQQYRERFGNGGEVGEAGYYVFHLVERATHPLGLITYSQQEQQLHQQRIRLLGLYGQLFDSEAQHPERALLGQIDFAFVLIFLLPVFVLLLARDFASEEQESHRLHLLETLRSSVTSLWVTRLFVRWLGMSAALLVPLWIYAALKQWQLTDVLIVSGVSGCYLVFWLGLFGSLSVLLKRRGEMLLATLYLCACLTLTWIVPSLAQKFAALRYPASEGAQIALLHRESVSSAWDKPKADTFKKFFVHHPQYQNTPPVLTRFHWKWYFAFHQVADEEVLPLVTAYQTQHRQRQRFLEAAAWINPSLAAQINLVNASGNSLQDALKHQAAIAEFHRRLRAFSSPLIFSEQRLTPELFDQMPRFEAAPARSLQSLHWAPLIGSSALSMLCFFICLRRGKSPAY